MPYIRRTALTLLLALMLCLSVSAAHAEFVETPSHVVPSISTSDDTEDSGPDDPIPTATPAPSPTPVRSGSQSKSTATPDEADQPAPLATPDESDPIELTPYNMTPYLDKLILENLPTSYHRNFNKDRDTTLFYITEMEGTIVVLLLIEGEEPAPVGILKDELLAEFGTFILFNINGLNLNLAKTARVYMIGCTIPRATIGGSSVLYGSDTKIDRLFMLDRSVALIEDQTEINHAFVKPEAFLIDATGYGIDKVYSNFKSN